ncbi:MAG: hypothetical protein OES38_01605 [Gammaproteobacteria bacterium]|nr:hypothetical protein [Gammaproteobacteria bacterium]
MRTRALFRSTVSLLAAGLVVGASATAHASEPPADLDLPVSQDAEAAHQIEADRVRLDWRLDPAIFTEISPVNAPEVAIKLPADQREDP